VAKGKARDVLGHANARPRQRRRVVQGQRGQRARKPHHAAATTAAAAEAEVGVVSQGVLRCHEEPARGRGAQRGHQAKHPGHVGAFVARDAAAAAAAAAAGKPWRKVSEQGSVRWVVPERVVVAAVAAATVTAAAAAAAAEMSAGGGAEGGGRALEGQRVISETHQPRRERRAQACNPKRQRRRGQRKRRQ